MVNKKDIKVSVLMPVFNSKLYIKEAIESILAQTYSNFELIIINDGSTDGADEVIRSFKDVRIKFINNKINKGIVATLNEGLALSTGKYIARMDSDDISLPHRLEKQVAFLENNPEYKLCGSQATAVSSKGEKLHKLRRPTDFENIKVFNLFRNAFIHPTIMADACLLKKIGYDDEYVYAEDYFLFSQLTMNHKVADLGDELLYYRLHNDSITSKENTTMVKSELKTMEFLLSFLFDELDPKFIALHHSVLRPKQASFTKEETHQHFISILEKNREKKLFSPSILRKQLQKEWYKYLLLNAKDGALTAYLKSPLFHFLQGLNPKYIFKLLLK